MCVAFEPELQRMELSKLAREQQKARTEERREEERSIRALKREMEEDRCAEERRMMACEKEEMAKYACEEAALSSAISEMKMKIHNERKRSVDDSRGIEKSNNLLLSFYLAS